MKFSDADDTNKWGDLLIKNLKNDDLQGKAGYAYATY